MDTSRSRLKCVAGFSFLLGLAAAASAAPDPLRAARDGDVVVVRDDAANQDIVL